MNGSNLESRFKQAATNTEMNTIRWSIVEELVNCYLFRLSVLFFIRSLWLYVRKLNYKAF